MFEITPRCFARLLVGLMIFLAVAPFARAQYPAAKPNENIAEEIAGDPNRLLPRTEHFAFAADTDIFFRNSGAEEFYHGIGYWLQLRSEARFNSNFRLNVRSVFYAGSISYGYVQPSGVYHMVSVTAVVPEPVLGARVTVQGPDLGRQTLGQGLFIQDHEFNGALARFDWSEDYGLIARADGTGILRQNDDTYTLELDLFKKYLGFTGVFWPQGIEQDQLQHERAHLVSAFSAHTYNWFSYAAEYGMRGGVAAGLLNLSAQTDATAAFHARVKIEARHYNPNFAADFAGRIEQQYISYDQYDKDFTSPMNLFVIDDGASVGAVHLDLWWKVNDAWRLHSLNELGRFDYDLRDDYAYYFTRQGVDRCFTADGREDCVTLFFSNKVLMNSDARPPQNVSHVNEPLFKTFPFFGVEARFRF